MAKKPRLLIELVPPLSWGRNVRSVVATDTWDGLRWYFGALEFQPYPLSSAFPDRPFRSELKCTYCGVRQEALHLHEEWYYDDEKWVQRLVGLQPICSKCHLTKHMGYANSAGRTDEALAHLAQVNGWTIRQAKAHSDCAFAIWETRAGIRYTLDFGYLERCIPPTKIHTQWLDNPRTWVGNRLDAIVWANRLLESDAIVVDTETTGLLEKSNVEVIELVAVNMKGKLIYQSLFKPRCKIPKPVIKIHGITNEEVKSSPSFAQEAEKIIAALHGRTIVTFNAKFDRDVIARTFKQNGLESISARWECAMQAFRTFSGSGHYLPLPASSHRALADCRATLRLIRKMARAHL
jgi:hypothetical protein